MGEPTCRLNRVKEKIRHLKYAKGENVQNKKQEK